MGRAYAKMIIKQRDDVLEGEQRSVRFEHMTTIGVDSGVGCWGDGGDGGGGAAAATTAGAKPDPLVDDPATLIPTPQNALTSPPSAVLEVMQSKERSALDVVIAHVVAPSFIRAGLTTAVQPTLIELAGNEHWRGLPVLSRIFTAVQVEPTNSILLLVVDDYRPRSDGEATTLTVFEELGLAGFYRDAPEACAEYATHADLPDDESYDAAWQGAAAISTVSDFLEYAVVWREDFDASGPGIMIPAGGCRGGLYNSLRPVKLADGSLRNPDPGWIKKSGF